MTEPDRTNKEKNPQTAESDARRAAFLPTILTVGVFLAGAAALWALRWTRGRAACDQYEYHLPAILKFARELPRPDLRDYLSATTPGYHLVMAAVARLASPDPLVLQIVAAVFTVALLLVFARALGAAGARQGRNWLELTALALPLVACPYVFTSGVWLLPENAGWLLALLTVLACLKERMSGRTLAGCGVMLTLLVVVRQSHLWAAAPMLAAAWLHATPSSDEGVAGLILRFQRRLPRLLTAGLACLPAVGVFAVFAWMWHGLTPPSFQAQHLVKGGSIINWATVPFILSLVAAFSPFYLGWLWPGLVKLWRESRLLLTIIAGAALVCSIIPETTFLREPRSSGLWNVVEGLDNAGAVFSWHGKPHTSPLIVLLAPIGAVMLAAWLTLINNRCRWIAIATVAAFLAAQSANANCWQRYHEPFLLMLFSLIAAGYGASAVDPGMGRCPSMLAAWRIVGPLALAGVLAAVTVGGVAFGRDPLHPDPKQTDVPTWRDPAH
jgi:hypothetical protein